MEAELIVDRMELEVAGLVRVSCLTHTQGVCVYTQPLIKPGKGDDEQD